MIKIVSILLILGIVANICIAQEPGFNIYCCLECGNEHTMCKYNVSGPGPNCTGFISSKLGRLDKLKILDMHNRFRQQIALNSASDLIGAANMRQMVWDNQLEAIATRWNEQCDHFRHDECRATRTIFFSINTSVYEVFASIPTFTFQMIDNKENKGANLTIMLLPNICTNVVNVLIKVFFMNKYKMKSLHKRDPVLFAIVTTDFPQIGQNMGYKFAVRMKASAEGIIQRWFNEHHYMPRLYFNRLVNTSYYLLKGRGSKMNRDLSYVDFGHFTQVVWAKTWKVGCSVVLRNIMLHSVTSLVCNYYPAGNNLFHPVYINGAACSRCPEGTECSKEYPGLCYGDEVCDHNLIYPPWCNGDLVDEEGEEEGEEEESPEEEEEEEEEEEGDEEEEGTAEKRVSNNYYLTIMVIVFHFIN